MKTILKTKQFRGRWSSPNLLILPDAALSAVLSTEDRIELTVTSCVKRLFSANPTKRIIIKKEKTDGDKATNWVKIEAIKPLEDRHFTFIVLLSTQVNK